MAQPGSQVPERHAGAVFAEGFWALVSAEFPFGAGDEESPVLIPHFERLRRAREDGLRELLDDWSPEREAELDVRLKTLARDCIDQDTARLRHDEAYGKWPDAPATVRAGGRRT